MTLVRCIAFWLGLVAVLAHAGAETRTARIESGQSAHLGADASPASVTAESLDRALAMSFCGRGPHLASAEGDGGQPGPATPRAPCLDCCCPGVQAVADPEFATLPAMLGLAVTVRPRWPDRSTPIAEDERRLPPVRAPPVTA